MQTIQMKICNSSVRDTFCIQRPHSSSVTRLPEAHPLIRCCVHRLRGCSETRSQFYTLRCKAAAPTVSEAVQTLADLELAGVLNPQGLILPDTPDDAGAHVFAIYDSHRKLQYIGFSSDLYNSLRTIFSRRPDKAFFYKAVHLQEVDQEAMIALRTAWFEENGGPPPGNKLALERTQWQQPVEAFTISERGRRQAADEQLKMQLDLIRSRGCRETFTVNTELLDEGKVDFLTVPRLTPEELARKRAEAAELAAKLRECEFEFQGHPAVFKIFFHHSLKTNGGWMFDVAITFEDKETEHRVVVGKDYYEPVGITEIEAVERAFAFLLNQRTPRHTEGLLEINQFPSNYFSLGMIDHYFDNFAEEFSRGLKALPKNRTWHMDRVEDWGYALESTESLAYALALSDSESEEDSDEDEERERGDDEDEEEGRVNMGMDDSDAEEEDDDDKEEEEEEDEEVAGSANWGGVVIREDDEHVLSRIGPPVLEELNEDGTEKVEASGVTGEASGAGVEGK